MLLQYIGFRKVSKEHTFTSGTTLSSYTLKHIYAFDLVEPVLVTLVLCMLTDCNTSQVGKKKTIKTVNIEM